MPSFSSILSIASLASLSLAITVTKPTKFQLWDSGKANTISWDFVSTDPQTVDIYLAHMAAQPPLNSLLFANVPISQKQAVVEGLQLPTGEAYQINLVAHDKPEQIYAQSQQFNVTGEGVDSTKTLDGYTGPTYTPTGSKTTLAASTTSGSKASSTSASSSATKAASEGSNSTTTSASAGSASASASASSVPKNAAAGNFASTGLVGAVMLGVVALFI